MILMSKLFQALNDNTRLLLLGDKDQLASVEVGSVLGDMCGDNPPNTFSPAFSDTVSRILHTDLLSIPSVEGLSSGLQDCIVSLRRNYRFSSQSGIGHLSRMVQSGDAKGVLGFLASGGDPEVEWIQESRPDTFSKALGTHAVDGYGDYLALNDPGESLKALNRFKILSVFRLGPFGADASNGIVAQALASTGILDRPSPHSAPWYKGRPVLITRNDYRLELFNGDLGIAWPADDTGDRRVAVYFRSPTGELRRFWPGSLPGHETAFVLTVHKSQGSEFDHILLILPNRDHPLITRELIYTAITRARRRVTVWADPDVLVAGISRTLQRTSGLRDTLWDTRSGFHRRP